MEDLFFEAGKTIRILRLNPDRNNQIQSENDTSEKRKVADYY
jgi:hypothetical protein